MPFVLRGRDVRRFSVIVHSCGMICSIGMNKFISSVNLIWYEIQPVWYEIVPFYGMKHLSIGMKLKEWYDCIRWYET